MAPLAVWPVGDEWDRLDDEARSWAGQGIPLLVAGPADANAPLGWIGITSYDETECALLFSAPTGDQYRSYVRTLLDAALGEAARLGYLTVVCHWRGGWASAQPVLVDLEFAESAPGSGVWKRLVKLPA